METQPDSYLMQLVQQGDTAQIALLFERHHMALLRHLPEAARPDLYLPSEDRKQTP